MIFHRCGIGYHCEFFLTNARNTACKKPANYSVEYDEEDEGAVDAAGRHPAYICVEHHLTLLGVGQDVGGSLQKFWAVASGRPSGKSQSSILIEKVLFSEDEARQYAKEMATSAPGRPYYILVSVTAYRVPPDVAAVEQTLEEYPEK